MSPLSGLQINLAERTTINIRSLSRLTNYSFFNSGRRTLTVEQVPLFTLIDCEKDSLSQPLQHFFFTGGARAANDVDKIIFERHGRAIRPAVGPSGNALPQLIQ